MKFLVDAQLPPGLAEAIRNTGHDAAHVYDLKMGDSSDREIWALAIRDQYVLISKDEDFSALKILNRSNNSLIWVRIGNCSRQALLKWFMPMLPDLIRRIEAGETFIELI